MGEMADLINETGYDNDIYKQLDPFATKRKSINKNRVMITTVKSVQPNGTWDSPHGTMYKYEYEMEDGTILTAQHKTEGGNFQIGETVQYEVKGENSYGKWGKVSKPEDSPRPSTANNSTSDSILYQVCLKGVMDFSIAAYNPGFESSFNAEDLNKLALEIAQKAKENIGKL